MSIEIRRREIEREIGELRVTEFASRDLGMIDQVVYVRFASIDRDACHLESFEQALGVLRTTGLPARADKHARVLPAERTG